MLERLACCVFLIGASACSDGRGVGGSHDSGSSEMDAGTVVLADSGLRDSGPPMSVYDATPLDGCEQPPGGCGTGETGCGAVEVCGNGLDDDCNGSADEDCVCEAGTVQLCFLGPPSAHQVGTCRDGSQSCTGGVEFGTWGPCVGSSSPSAEGCDALDNDCNGCVDDISCCTPVDAMCNHAVAASIVTPSLPTCFVDEVVGGMAGLLEFRCAGGEASITFGGHTFEGTFVDGMLDVRLTTTFTFSDGCMWQSTQRIDGDVASGTLSYEYVEAILPGQTGCATACSATASVVVSP